MKVGLGFIDTAGAGIEGTVPRPGFRCKMVMIKIGIIFLLLTLINQCFGNPRHVYHRIHVPTRIKTIYHTKIIKIPEHHHYIHEKEKPHLVKIPEHHHYFHEKEKEKPSDLHDFHHKEDEPDFQDDYESDHDSYSHSVFKKHAPAHRYKKRKH